MDLLFPVVIVGTLAGEIPSDKFDLISGLWFMRFAKKRFYYF